MRLVEVLEFYRGKRILITGHTGFKGSWLSKILLLAGADVTGYAFEPKEDKSLFKLSGLGKEIKSITGDVRDYEHLSSIFSSVRPEVVFHLAAQPIVRESYRIPRYTYETNVMGTVNICECIRLNDSVESFLNVTTDKVYDNKEWCWGYRETEPLDGFDPYSNSKSCSELVTHAYRNSFFSLTGLPVSTARAGNVIGGGDFSQDRIVPDAVRAALSGGQLCLRNPDSIRPYQHVLEPLSAYLMIAAMQTENSALAGAYNVGPESVDNVTTGELVSLFADAWGKGFSYLAKPQENAPHEAELLYLDTSLIKKKIGWQPRMHIKEAVEKTVEWTKSWQEGQQVECMDRQIKEYFNL